MHIMLSISGQPCRLCNTLATLPVTVTPTSLPRCSAQTAVQGLLACQADIAESHLGPLSLLEDMSQSENGCLPCPLDGKQSYAWQSAIAGRL